jgi:hypothetical protein
MVLGGTYRGKESTNGFENGPPVHHHDGRPDVVATQKCEVMIFLYVALFPDRER